MGVYPGVDAKMAHLPGVKAAVHAKGREIEARRTCSWRRTTAPARRTSRATSRTPTTWCPWSTLRPLSIEFGRGGYTTKSGAQIGPAEGLHVLRRAAGI
jgi:hypothetical protein